MGRDEVVARLGNIWQAHLEGNEIASHGCGHFDGTDWSAADWDKEIKEFRRITADAYKNNGISGEPEGWRDLALKGTDRFRAPYLAASKPVQERAQGKRFSLSGIVHHAWPVLPTLPVSLLHLDCRLFRKACRNALSAMDYNLYVRHSKGSATAIGSFLEERA